MIPTQMLKGTLEGCVLAVIAQGETYGYEICERLEACGVGAIAEGTVYPLLQRLVRAGYATTSLRASDQGPRRKYYRLTAEGREALNRFDAEFAELTGVVGALLKDARRSLS